jgi:hypothetical protein
VGIEVEHVEWLSHHEPRRIRLVCKVPAQHSQHSQHSRAAWDAGSAGSVGDDGEHSTLPDPPRPSPTLPKNDNENNGGEHGECRERSAGTIHGSAPPTPRSWKTTTLADWDRALRRRERVRAGRKLTPPDDDGPAPPKPTLVPDPDVQYDITHDMLRPPTLEDQAASRARIDVLDDILAELPAEVEIEIRVAAEDDVEAMLDRGAEYGLTRKDLKGEIPLARHRGLVQGIRRVYNQLCWVPGDPHPAIKRRSSGR